MMATATDLERIIGESAARALANDVHDRSRTQPIVVVSTPPESSAPLWDAIDIAEELGDLARVVILPHGEESWEFSRVMPQGTQVYGGAARVYPAGLAWLTDLAAAPLLFAFTAADARVKSPTLVSHAMRAAAASGQLDQARRAVAKKPRTKAKAKVKSLLAGSRAMVRLESGEVAAIASELLLADVTIERIVQQNQVVEGWYDRELGRLDVSESLLDRKRGLAHYEQGDLIWVRVERVALKGVTVEPFPGVVIRVPAANIETSGDLYTAGEVVPARVLTTEPELTLALVEVDESTVLPAPAVLIDGPSWLVWEPAPEVIDEPAPATAVTLPPVIEETRGVGPEILAMRQEVRQLREEISARDKEISTLEHREKGLRDRLRRASGKTAAVAQDDAPAFADRDLALRYAITGAWARRVPAGEQASRPLGEYSFGPEFLDTVDRIDGVTFDKIVDVIVEILTGLADTMPGREMHQFRSSDNGDAAAYRRESDGAICWRVSLQVKTPQARRIHFWRIPGGGIELSRVGLHDELKP